MQKFTRSRTVLPGFSPVERDGLDGIVYVKGNQAYAYRGKSTKMAWNFIFMSESNRDKYINGFFDDIKEHGDRVAKRRAALNDFKTVLVVGDILYTSWGYEQTNVEFFKVISVKNNMVIVKQLRQKTKETGIMSGSTVPCEEFQDDIELRRRVGGPAGHDYVKIDDVRHAWPWDGKPHYVSWYG